MQRPNILWFSIEDISPRFGCTGDVVARTPNIDRLAAEGRRYANAFSTAGVCAPSRCAIITGMYQTAIGAHHMRTTHTNDVAPEMPTPYEAVPPAYVKAFPEYLRAAGYYCTNNAKTDYQFAPPSSAWDVCGRDGHWRNGDRSQPFFAVFNPTVTHESGMWPKEGERLTTDPDAVTLPPYIPDTPKAREAMARHYDNLERADARLGEVLAQLDEDGLTDNTIVVLWSDHGEGLPRGKRWLYDAGIRIPLIVRWPGSVPAGEVSERLVSLIDLAPTMLSLAGLEPPRHMQGRPFLGPGACEREYAFAARDRHDEAYDMVRAVRDTRYKYIRNFHPELPYLLWIPYRNRHPALQEMWRLRAEDALTPPLDVMFQTPRPCEELYDTHADPYELDNLAGRADHAERLARMRAALRSWQDEHGDLGHEPEAEMAARMWPNGEQPTTARPTFVPICASSPGMAASPDGRTFPGPALLQLHCATQGASIGYRTGDGDADGEPWRLYTEPLALPAGATTIRARASRIGYADSATREATFVTAPAG
ncbi:sulfatase [Candidatus Poribacteria bacterium]|nr:sulfatase [Candidatus Poribacteria bacterium]